MLSAISFVLFFGTIAVLLIVQFIHSLGDQKLDHEGCEVHQ